MWIAPSATKVGNNGGNYYRSEENPPEEIRPVVFPLRLPAPFREDVGDAALLEVAKDASHNAQTVCQHQGQPVAVARFAVLESQAAERAARSRGRRRCTEHGGEVGSLVGVQDLDGRLLPRRALPGVARLFAVVAQLHRVGRVVLRVCVHAPPLDPGGVLGRVLHDSSSSLYVLTDGGIKTGLMHSSSFAEKIL